MNSNYSDYDYTIQHNGLSPIWQQNQVPQCTKEHIWLSQNQYNYKKGGQYNDKKTERFI